MGYGEEKVKLISYVTDNGAVIPLASDRSNEKKYYKELDVLNTGKRLAIRYPGYKSTITKCDYCVYLVDGIQESPISHKEIMMDLYNKTTTANYERLKEYIGNVALFGRDIDKTRYVKTKDGKSEDEKIDFDIGFAFEELTGLMFYIAIQEDINYPETRYQGRKMCFYRYLEAIYCKCHNGHTIEEAIRKATEKRIPPNWDNVGDLYDSVNRIRR